MRTEQAQRMRMVPFGNGQFGSRRGHENLPAVAERQKPGDAIQRGPEIVVVAALRRSDVHGHPHGETAHRGPVFRGKRLLRGDGRVESVCRRANAA